ncbi:MAG: hypothetical protein JJU10_01775 [Idiomarina sp.]|nr:hypothetical protein [Idiomarina sp.]
MNSKGFSLFELVSVLALAAGIMVSLVQLVSPRHATHNELELCQMSLQEVQRQFDNEFLFSSGRGEGCEASNVGL